MIGPRLQIAGRSWRLFHLCGLAGFCAALAQSLALASHARLEVPLIFALLACSVVVMIVLGIASKIVAGRDVLVYYHNEIAVLLASAALLRVIGRPVATYLDVVAVGLGSFLAFGRLGCLVTGCCHGRIHQHGVRYGAAHVRNGFPQCYAHVAVLPVQAIESAAAAAISAAGIVMFW